MRPTLPTASSKVTPSDSKPPTIDGGPPIEIISDSSSASVPSPSTRLLASSLTTASRTMEGSVGTDHQGALQHPGLLRNRPHDDCSLSSHNNANFLLRFIRHDERRGCQLIHRGFINFFIIHHNYLNSRLTNLSASIDVTMIFRGTIEEENSNFPHSQISFSICLTFSNLSYIAN